MSRLKVRKPFGNFFIKKNLQLRLIAKIVLSVLISTAVFAGTLILMYHLSYSSAAFYQVSLRSGAAEIGDRLEIVTIILPSLLISAVVNVIIAIFVGMYASRKYAVPIYKLEQWATLLSQGKLTANLRFREREEMRELSEKCNASTKNIREKLLKVKTEINAIAEQCKDSSAVKQAEELMDSFELESEIIEVRTNYMARPNVDKK